jgi:hypothetical protein
MPSKSPTHQKSIERIRERDRVLEGVQESNGLARFWHTSKNAISSVGLILVGLFLLILLIGLFFAPLAYTIASPILGLSAWAFGVCYLAYTVYACKQWWKARYSQDVSSFLHLAMLVGFCLIGGLLLFWFKDVEPKAAVSLMSIYSMFFMLVCLLVQSNPKLSSLTIPFMLYSCFYLSLQAVFLFHETLSLPIDSYRSVETFLTYLNNLNLILGGGVSFYNMLTARPAQT